MKGHALTSFIVWLTGLAYIIAAPCTGGNPDVPGLPQCEMPENLSGTAWNEVSNSNGLVLGGAVCSAQVCGRNGEWRTLMNYPPSSTYIQTPYDGASWGQYYTNGVWVRADNCVMQPGASSPQYCIGPPTRSPTQRTSIAPTTIVSSKPSPAPTATPTEGTCKAHRATVRNAIGLKAKQNALPASTHLCLRYVRKAIAAALQKEYPPHPVAACGQAAALLKMGFKPIVAPGVNGDIAMFACVEEHKYGHIQALYQDRWYSDFAQNNFSPWKNLKGSTVTYFRYMGCDE